MGRKSNKVNSTQPKRTFFSSSSSPSQHTPKVPSTPTAKPVQTPVTIQAPTNLKSSLGDTLKQGMATGLGFGLANAAIGSIAGSMGKTTDDLGQMEINRGNQTNVSNPNFKNPCESFLDLYTNCLKSQANLMEDNCEYFLAQFKNCRINSSPNIQNIQNI